MTGALFSKIGRSSSARKIGESAFSFLQRLDSPQADLLRSSIEFRLQSPPDEFRRRLLRDLTSDEDWRHESAMFELFLHQFLLDSGLPIVEYEPLVGGSRPDFIIEWPDKQRILVEASVIERTPREEATEEGFQDQIWQALQQLPDSDRVFHLHFEGEFASQPRSKRVALALSQQMTLDPSKKEYCCRERGVSISVTEVTKREVGSLGQTVGFASIGRSGFFYPQGRLRAKISKKYAQVRPYEGPKIIAISCPALEFGSDVLTAALFGDERFTFNADLDAEPRFSRKGNGLLIHQGSPQFTGLSGVLIFDQSATFGFSESDPIYFENPWAVWKLDGSALPVTRFNPDPNKNAMVKTPREVTPSQQA